MLLLTNEAGTSGTQHNLCRNAGRWKRWDRKVRLEIVTQKHPVPDSDQTQIIPGLSEFSPSCFYFPKLFTLMISQISVFLDLKDEDER